jgi:hypothetical protein
MLPTRRQAMDMESKTSRGLLAAIVGLLGILAGALAYASGVAVGVDAAPLLVWGLRALAFVCFVLGIAMAVLAVMAEMTSARPRAAAELSLGLALVVLASGAGVYLGARLASDPDPASGRFADRLTHVFSGLSHERDAHLPELSQAETAEGQSAVASALAEAFEDRRRALLELHTSASDRPVVKRIAKRLLAVSEAYAHLGAAADDPTGGAGDMEQARKQINRAESQLEQSQVRLSRKGYLLTFR